MDYEITRTKKGGYIYSNKKESCIAKLKWSHYYKENRYNYYNAYGCNYYQYTVRINDDVGIADWSCDPGYSCECGTIYCGEITNISALKEMVQKHHENIVNEYLK